MGLGWVRSFKLGPPGWILGSGRKGARTVRDDDELLTLYIETGFHSCFELIDLVRTLRLDPEKARGCIVHYAMKLQANFGRFEDLDLSIHESDKLAHYPGFSRKMERFGWLAIRRDRVEAFRCPYIKIELEPGERWHSPETGERGVQQ